jgi:DNA-binding Lrp family transcriptional regulator
MMDNIVILSFAEAKQPEYREKKGVGYIEFGDKNDYPTYLLGLYNKSAKHNAIVRGKVNYIIGNGWQSDEVDAQAELFIKAPNPYESLIDITRKVSSDVEIFGGAYLEVIWSKVGGLLAEICHIDYTKIRSNKDNTQFWYKQDWSDRKEEAKVIPAYNTQNRVGKQIMYIKEYRPGLDTYALPGYMGSLNYIESDVEVSKHVLGNAQTGFSASKLITLPNGEPSPDEKRNIERRFTDRFSGSDGKKFILSFVQDSARKPIVEDLGASDLTKEDFGRVDEMIQQNIFAGHQITAPDLFGISTPGALGSRSQIRDAYEIFKNTYVNDKQQFLEAIFNNLAKQRGVTSELTIKPVEPISYEFSESIIAQFAPKEWILEKIGVDMTKYQPEPTAVTPEPSQAMINEHLKGMKGREWQNFQRIIREYNKGKITREQASQMLKSAYGLGEEELATWLGADEFSNDMDAVIQVFSEYGDSVDNYKTLMTRQVFGKDLEQEELAFRDEVIDDTLDKKILDVIAKNKGISDEDIAKAVKEDLVVVKERINKLQELDILKINSKGVRSLTKPLSEIIDKPVKTSFLVRYSYEWKSIVPPSERNTSAHPSRPFCAKLMSLDRLYSRSEIESISRRLGYSVFDRGGGWWNMGDGVNSPSCRHQWVSKVVIKKDK